ncbi:hypothetical protein CLV28_1103 [Sediminihabitans luteus]|uniref:Uridine kinase n=1 Tax=Sediminihabitans luteus TaxID=1138585 RepID=A0A2M9D176_9CELL|nr:uridine kinase [Sediminihabitans luteus]PJJ77877.1 hypothetical protein CLV28_1103 [Sediminihabitans luteus]GII99765.1 hypothetical protein Slu03_21430 [Sediminihabitans luteus]
MRVEPLTPQALVERLTDSLAALPRERRWRVLVDGHPSTRPGDLADTLVEPLHAAGRAAPRVRTGDFLRAASLRLEHGRHDPDSYLDERLDVAALDREVLRPFGPQGAGTYLPSLRDPRTDRSTRAVPVAAPPGAVLLLDAHLALGLGLAVDVTVHLAVRPETLARRVAADDAWTLPAYARYRAETDPERVADVVVRVDDARHPALVLP